MNYHVEHRLFPAVPRYRLPGLHEELQRRSVVVRAEVRPLYEALRCVFADPAAIAPSR